MQVEFAYIKCGELGAGAREDAVEDELGKFKLYSRGSDVAGKVDAIAADGDAHAVGIALLLVELANHFGVSYLFSAVNGDIFKADEEEVVAAFDTLASAVGRGADALADPAEFV